jgi:hypothetical protein
VNARRRWICQLLSLLGKHGQDCEHCKARQAHGNELRKRLEELNGRSRPQPPSREVQNTLKFPQAG